MQVLVLGPHRSGTSLVTRVVNLLGAYVGESAEQSSAEDNPKGFWERRDGVAINEAILDAAGCRWDRLAAWSFDAPRHDALRAETRDAMRATVADLDAHRPWVLKDPRLCLTLPYWTPLLSQPVAVVVTRHPAEVAVSLQTRNGMSLAHALAIFEYCAVGVLRHTRAWPTVRVTYDEMLADPVGGAARLKHDLEACGVAGLHDPDPSLLGEFVDKALHRSHATRQMTESLISPRLEQLHDALRRGDALSDAALEPSAMATSVMDDVAQHEAERREWADRMAERDRAQTFVAAERDHARATSDQVRGDLVQVTSQRDDLVRGLADTHALLSNALARAAAEQGRLQGATSDLEARLQRLRSDLGQRSNEISRLGGDLAHRQATIESLNEAVRWLSEERDSERERLRAILESKDYRWGLRIGRIRRALRSRN